MNKSITNITRQEMLEMRLQGFTYEKIAKRAHVSRQRVQQLLSPPKAIRDIIIKRANGLCQDCGILVGSSGHVHHQNTDCENYQDIDNLFLLCISCHRLRHPFFIYPSVKRKSPLSMPEKVKPKREINPNAKTALISNMDSDLWEQTVQVAHSRGQTLSQFISEAIEEKIAHNSETGKLPRPGWVVNKRRLEG